MHILEYSSFHYLENKRICERNLKKMKSKNAIGLLGLSGFIVMADNWVVSPILPAISQHLNVDIARAGLLISAP